MAELDLRPVVDAYYVLSPMGLVARTMNVGAILSNSTMISTTKRVEVVSNINEVLDLGFTTDSLEYKAAQVYFGASSRPSKLAIIRVVLDDLSGYPTLLTWSGSLQTGDMISVDENGMAFQGATATTVSYVGSLRNGNIVTVGDTVFNIVAESSEVEGEYTTSELVDALANSYYGEFLVLAENTVSLIFRNTSTGPELPTDTVTVAQGTGAPVTSVVIAEGVNSNAADLVAWLKNDQGASASTSITSEGVGSITFANAEEGHLDPEKTLTVTRSGVDVGTINIIYGASDSFAEPIGTALADARRKNAEWYSVCHLTNRSYNDLKAIADFAESASPSSMAFIWSADPDILTEDENAFNTLKQGKYRHTNATWHPDYAAAVGAMGYAMGQMKKTANSSFTLAMKTFPSAIPSDLTSSQVTKVESYNANVYINRGGYNMYEKGTQLSGDFTDEIIQLDNLVSEISTAVANLLTSRPKIPQTEPGMSTIKDVIGSILVTYTTQGLIAPGVWNGPAILELQPGQYLSNGFLVLSEPIDTQPVSDRAARKAPPIYAIIKLAGAIHSVIIEVDVDR